MQKKRDEMEKKAKGGEDIGWEKEIDKEEI